MERIVRESTAVNGLFEYFFLKNENSQLENLKWESYQQTSRE